MYYEVETKKSVEEAGGALEAAVKTHGFGVLHIHDLGGTLRKKGVEFGEECKVFEVCNPLQAAKVLASDMRLNNALPCRISIYTDSGTTKIGFIKPTEMLALLSKDAELAKIAAEVEEKITRMVEDSK